jgi:hypothetical protein
MFNPISALRGEVDTALYELPKELPWNTLNTTTRSVDICDFLLNPIDAQLKYLRSRFDRSNLPSQGPGAEPGAEPGTKHAVEQSRAVTRLYRPMQRLLWRLLDLHKGDAVGFMLELYIVSLREILSTSAFPSDDSHDTFFSAIEAIIANRDLSQCTIWTQELILALICDIAANRGIFSDFNYPDFVEEELVRLLRNVVAGVHDVSNIELAVKDLEHVKSRQRHGGFREKVLDVLKHLPGPSPAGVAPAGSYSAVMATAGPLVRPSTMTRTGTISRPPHIQLRVNP